ncbi:hypothetical protein SEA_TUNATARTARE_145 [Streptomyces phage TunaTartare]|uniref:Uncharacterized protein n=1 Tax=Streptomyces phage TunaTartare TaxID=2848887 RepID=A0A8F2IWG2_9CAUD|nr:hypothetical protein PP457_gp125 [Streptomyces phage TunaTartare]QWT30017.1 hypothetical protein SEA_TUNATARTARE_145 [Streptomyces phage TunaTartare]
MKILRRKWKFKEKNCPHAKDRIRNIYGDEIRYARYNRSTCMDCGKFFPKLNGES